MVDGSFRKAWECNKISMESNGALRKLEVDSRNDSPFEFPPGGIKLIVSRSQSGDMSLSAQSRFQMDGPFRSASALAESLNGAAV
jgi:hypothetical protein